VCECECERQTMCVCVQDCKERVSDCVFVHLCDVYVCVSVG